MTSVSFPHLFHENNRDETRQNFQKTSSKLNPLKKQKKATKRIKRDEVDTLGVFDAKTNAYFGMEDKTRLSLTRKKKRIEQEISTIPLVFSINKFNPIE